MRPEWICPRCRSARHATPLTESLRCPRCGAAHARLSPSLALIARAGLARAIAASDRDIDRVDDARGSVAWQRASKLGAYVMCHYGDPEAPFAAMLDWALPLLGEVRRALDVGCGPGRMAIEIAIATDAEVVGLDVDLPALRWAERATRSARLEVPRLASELSFELATVPLDEWDVPRERLSWVAGDAADVPLPLASQDLVSLVSVIDNCPDPASALGVACALTRIGGHVLLATPDAWQAECTPPDRWLADDVAGYTRLFAHHGFEVVDVLENIPWRLIRTARHAHHFNLYAMVARRVA